MRVYKKLITVEKNYLDTESRLNRLQRDKWVPVFFGFTS